MSELSGSSEKKGPSVLVLNPGSSSLKWALFRACEDPAPYETGHIKGKGINGEDRRVALQKFVDEHETGCAVIRFVHGGPDYVRPVAIDASSYPALKKLEALAPLHNRLSLDCIEALLERRPGLKLIAVFDTEFFHDLPRVARMYGLPAELARKHRLRRFGFHGFAHRDMARRWQALADDTERRGRDTERRGGDTERRGRDTERRDRIVTMQLGSGCSMAAIAGGRPLDTTMGFTPNEGLLMSTRSGDIDPGLVTWLQRLEGWGPDETDRILNEHSGWLGVSGESADMTDLLASGSEQAGDAIALFRYRIRKTLGAYYALLGGLDGVMAGGGIVEHAPSFVREILSGLEHLGIVLADAKSNARPDADLGPDGTWRFSTTNSPVACWCIRVDENRSMLDSASEHMQSDSVDI
ncbi:MAG: hypothetical protein WD396_05555 [Pseudohongiellaceae bacterium]